LTEQRLKIAVFIDFDNIEIGVKTTLGGQFDIGVVLEALKERGEVVSKTAYGDWKRAGDHSRSLTQHAIKMVQRNLTPGGDKNGADINLALDALEMAFTHDHINAFVIVGGDSDFITLVEKLKQYDKKVFVVGGRAFTSMILQRNCHEFVAYENLVGAQPSRRPAERGRPSAAQAPVGQAFPLVSRALKVLSDREVSPQLGLLKSTLLQLDSTFSERSYGASTFRDFAEKLAAAGFVNLKHSGRNILVELSETDGAPEGPAEERVDTPMPPPADVRLESAPSGNGESAVAAAKPVAADPERLAEGIREVRRMFAAAVAPLRWPMYVRNVKQYLRSVEQSFDERRYGYGSIVELLRACQREGMFRLERDRQGVLRIYPGITLQVPASSRQAAPAPVPEIVEVEEVVSGEPAADLPPDSDTIEVVAEPVTEESSPEPAERPAAARPSRRRTATGAAPRRTSSRSTKTARTPRVKRG